MKKFFASILALSLMFSMCTSVTYAVESTPVESSKSTKYEVAISQPTIEKAGEVDLNSSEAVPITANPLWGNLTTEKALELIKNSPKNYFHPASGVVTVEEVVNDYYNTYGVMPAANSTMTYESDKMETGTPGIYWSVKVTFVLAQKSNGTYYFSSISSGSITIHKNYLELTWASYVGTKTYNRHHSIIDSGASIKMETDIDFEVYYEGAITPITYTEEHETVIPVSYVSP